jgi:subtilase family serine protease
VVAKADGNDQIAETSETNNTKNSNQIKIGPDLTVYSMTVSSSAKTGATISITDTTKNGGAGEAGASTTSFYLSTDTTLDGGDTLLGSRSVGSLSAGASIQSTTSVTIPATTTPGAYYIIGKADAEGVVSETSETNNTSYRSISITTP